MSKRRSRIQQQRAAKRLRVARQQENPSGNSNYGRKRAFLHVHGGMGLDYPDKPWKSTKVRRAA